MASKVADQTTWLRRQTCAFVVHMHQSRIFSRHFCFMRSLLSHMLIVIVQRRIQRGSLPSRFQISYKMKSFGLRETKLFYFHWIFKKKEIKISTPTRTFIHMNPLSRNPGSVTVVLAACSHVHLLACMQQCACLSGGG